VRVTLPRDDGDPRSRTNRPPRSRRFRRSREEGRMPSPLWAPGPRRTGNTAASRRRWSQLLHAVPPQPPPYVSPPPGGPSTLWPASLHSARLGRPLFQAFGVSRTAHGRLGLSSFCRVNEDAVLPAAPETSSFETHPRLPRIELPSRTRTTSRCAGCTHPRRARFRPGDPGAP